MISPEVSRKAATEVNILAAVIVPLDNMYNETIVSINDARDRIQRATTDSEMLAAIAESKDTREALVD